MAEVERPVARLVDAAGGVFQMTVVVEDTQATVDPRGRVSETVVAVRQFNGSLQKAETTWQRSNGEWVTDYLPPGGSSVTETRISAANREYYHVWALRMSARWG